VEVTPRTHTNCTNEIKAEYNNTNVFIDPISFVIKAAAAPVRCNDIAPPRWRLNGRWYCAYPQIRDCSEPGRIPINIDDVDVMNLGLGRSIYSPEQLEEFMRFQESQGTRRAFLADSAERAYNSRVGGEWGSGLTGAATDSLIDAVGNHLVPMYRVIGPTAAVALLILFLVGVVRMLADIVVRAIAIARVRGCGWWLIGAFWGTLFHMAVAPVQWAMARGHTVGKNIGYQMDAEAARAADRDPEAQRLNPRDPDQPSAPRGPLNNLDRLVNWSHDFLNRNQDARIYPVPRDQGVPADAGGQNRNAGVAYENAGGGRVANL
jgi:hypothetical protein